MEYRDKLVLAPMVRVVTPLDPSPSHESVGLDFLSRFPSGAYDFGFKLVLKRLDPWIWASAFLYEPDFIPLDLDSRTGSSARFVLC